MNKLHDILLDIQENLTVPKARENEFGGFNYRSVEDIEIAIKPFLKKHKVSLTFEDEMIGVEGRVYVKATAILSDGTDEIKRTAYAREAEKPKAKTDDAQLTGGCSSYARKYAAQGLFLIDDGKNDPDNKGSEQAATLGVSSLSAAKQNVLKKLTDAGFVDSSEMINVIETALGKSTIDKIEDANKVIGYLKELEEKK